MTFEPDPLQTTLLLNLLFTGDEPKLSDCKPNLPTARRTQLVEKGLIELEKRKPPKGRAVTHIILTDKAWRWANENLTHPFSMKSTNTCIGYKGLLGKLSQFMKEQNLVLAHLLNPELFPAEQSEIVSPIESPAADLETRIRDAYLKVTGGIWHVQVRLRDLRKHLSDIPRDSQDEALKSMQLDNKLVLYDLDDPEDITPEDQAAAIDIVYGKRHIVYMGG